MRVVGLPQVERRALIWEGKGVTHLGPKSVWGDWSLG